jgi:hypothetical protein
MRSPIEFEKDHNYDRCRDSIDSDFSSSDHERADGPLTQEDVREDEVPLTPEPPPYSAFSLNRRRFMLGIVTAGNCSKKHELLRRLLRFYSGFLRAVNWSCIPPIACTFSRYLQSIGDSNQCHCLGIYGRICDCSKS